jgi:hypothetical protein
MSSFMLRVALAASIVANGVLLARLTLAPADPAAAPVVASHPLHLAAASTAATMPTPSHGSSWTQLRDDKPEIFMARLRAAGFPPRVLHAVVEVLLNDHFRLREQEIDAGEEDPPFWRVKPRAFDPPENGLALSRLQRERGVMRKALLGADYIRTDEEAQFYHRRTWGELPPHKIGRVEELFEHYGERRSEVQASSSANSYSIREKLVALDREHRAELERLFTPAELEHYDLRVSATASNLRFSSLQAMKLNEAEYLALYRLYRPFEDQLAVHYREATAEELAQRQRFEDSLQPQIKAALGAERYADYLHAKQPEYGQLNNLVARLELPLSAARAVAAVQRETTERIDLVRGDVALNAEQRNAQLAALAHEASAKITTMLGPRGFEAYKNYGGQWLTALSSRSPRP